MKRSDINKAILWAKELLKANNIFLPDYSNWTIDEWKANLDRTETIRKVALGWDVSEFGMGDFNKVGCVLYTMRNGSVKDPSLGVPYCEKYLLFKDGQRLPNHYHVSKTEDIINRSQGVMQLFLWKVDPETGKPTDADVEVYMDGIPYSFKPGEEILVYPGNSITLPPYVTHIFGPKPGTGELVAGEVSAINDDNTDNYFLEDTSRYSKIEEDEAPLHPLCNEYAGLI